MDDATIIAGTLAGVQYLKQFFPKEKHKQICPALAVLVAAGIAAFKEFETTGNITVATVLKGVGYGVVASGSLNVVSEYQKKGAERKAEAMASQGIGTIDKVTKASQV